LTSGAIIVAPASVRAALSAAVASSSIAIAAPSALIAARAVSTAASVAAVAVAVLLHGQRNKIEAFAETNGGERRRDSRPVEQTGRRRSMRRTDKQRRSDCGGCDAYD
jgi:hypothetical protein